MRTDWNKFLSIVVCTMSIMVVSKAHSQELTPGSHYVNLGSSFAAGSGVSPTRVSSGRCWQSERNYAALLAEKFDLQLVDRSCAGARSNHLTEHWDEIPPQIEAITSETRLVTITVGGNDLHYVGNLTAATCTDSEGIAVQGKTYPCPIWKTVEEEVDELVKHNISKAIIQIFAKAPEAKVILVQYLSLIPDQLCDATPLTPTQAAEMRAVRQRLTALTSTAAAESGATVLPTDKLSRSHTACNTDPWTIGFEPTADNSEGIFWHTNRRGNEVIAELLAKELAL